MPGGQRVVGALNLGKVETLVNRPCQLWKGLTTRCIEQCTNHEVVGKICLFFCKIILITKLMFPLLEGTIFLNPAEIILSVFSNRLFV